MLLSVIIAVYNAQDTLERCMESVLAQHVPDMEVVLVDDGSTDHSAAICDTYRDRANLTVVHQANQGLSTARNTGLTRARGTYVTFVDADDYLDDGVYALLLILLSKKPEVDILEYALVKDDGRQGKPLILSGRSYRDIWQYWFQEKAYLHAFMCNKIFRKTLFDTVRFPSGKAFEDVFVLPSLLGKARMVSTTSAGYYHYAYNPAGITAQAAGKEWNDLLEAYLQVLENKALHSYKGFGAYYSHVLNVQLHTYELTGNVADIRLPVLPFYSGLKVKLLHLIGMRSLCRTHRFLHKVIDAIARFCPHG